jgi:hypothetical protein
MDGEFYGKSRDEFIDFISDMLINDNALANEILNQYYNQKTKECWNLRTDIMVAWHNKKMVKEKKDWSDTLSNTLREFY